MSEKVKCKKCGLEIDPDCQTCPYCGYPQHEEIEGKDESNNKRITNAFFDKPQTQIKYEKQSNSKITFFSFNSRTIDINPYKSLAFFIIGFFLLKTIALIFSLIASTQSWYFNVSGAATAAINFSSYFLIFGIFALTLGKDISKIFKEFTKSDSYIYGIAFGFFMMIVSSAVTSFMNLFQQAEVNANEASIDSTTSLYPFLSIVIFGIVGPICEEFTYRVGLFTFIKKYNRVAAYLITALVFGLLHFTFNIDTIVTELINLPSYIVSGLLLCYFYDYKGFGASTIAHITNNLFALLIQLILSSIVL